VYGSVVEKMPVLSTACRLSISRDIMVTDMLRAADGA
jgi:hypothetical protein